MSTYRRSRIFGGTYFFTVKLQERGSALLLEQIGLLRHAVRVTRRRRPFRIDAWVVLPDHIHCVWTLPEGEADYSVRWKEIKALFSRSLERTEEVSAPRRLRGERGIWQRRFWEHAIRDERDYWAHIDYVHLNPYKHGLVEHVRDWPYSTFHRYVDAGLYPEGWMTDLIVR